MSEKGKPRLNSIALLADWQGEDDYWKSNTMLRETALSVIPAPFADSLQKSSAWLLEVFLDTNKPYPTYRGSIVKHQLRGAMLDLRHTARVLAELTLRLSDRNDRDYSPKLSLFTNGLANRVNRLANEIEERLSPGRRRTPPASAP